MTTRLWPDAVSYGRFELARSHASGPRIVLGTDDPVALARLWRYPPGK